jgi:hypothetical protein
MYENSLFEKECEMFSFKVSKEENETRLDVCVERRMF